MKKIFATSIIIVAAAFLAYAPAKNAKADTSSSFALTLGDQTFPVSQTDLDSWRGGQLIAPDIIFNPAPQTVSSSVLTYLGQPEDSSVPSVSYNWRLGPVYDFIQNLAQNIAKPMNEPALTIENNRAANFTAPQNGVAVDSYRSALAALSALQNNATSSPIIIYQLTPDKQLSSTNDLGINGLIAEGVSSFKGSPKNRRVNISAGLEKFKGLIIPAGATFSFDDNLGPVTAEAGFLPELVIDNGTTLPELGGGLCQVSTTTFRAAMQAGLPITARRNHAYAVQYYSPQGTDATIYPGSADLKFINDTPGAILIWPYEKDANTLIFDFYGTDDGRKVTLEKPVITDRQSNGAMKASWTREVISATGTPRTDVFKSNYQPPALFHKTETFVSASGTPTSAVH